MVNSEEIQREQLKKEQLEQLIKFAKSCQRFGQVIRCEINTENYKVACLISVGAFNIYQYDKSEQIYKHIAITGNIFGKTEFQGVLAECDLVNDFIESFTRALEKIVKMGSTFHRAKLEKFQKLAKDFQDS